MGTDYNLVLMDQRLPDGNGLDLIQEMRRERPHQLAIMITGHADVRVGTEHRQIPPLVGFVAQNQFTHGL